MKNMPKPWSYQVNNLNRVPIIDPTSNNTASDKVFGIVTKAFKDGGPAVAAGGLSMGAIISGATAGATIIAGVVLFIVGLNIIEGVYGKDIRKKLGIKEEPTNVKKEKAQRTKK